MEVLKIKKLSEDAIMGEKTHTVGEDPQILHTEHLCVYQSIPSKLKFKTWLKSKKLYLENTEYIKKSGQLKKKYIHEIQKKSKGTTRSNLIIEIHTWRNDWTD